MGACKRMLRGEGRALAALVAVLVALVLAWPAAAQASEVAGRSENNDAWHWSLSDDGTLTIGGQGIETTGPGWEAPWEKSRVKRVVFESGSTTGDCLANMFDSCTSLESVTWNGLDTSSATSMGNMFSQCLGLRSIDFSGLDTSSVTDMGGLLRECPNLLSVTFGSDFDTSSVTNMTAMFYNCGNLESLDLSSFDMRAVETMHNMFYECDELASVTLGSGFRWVSGSTNPYLPAPADGLTWVRLDGATGLPVAGDKGYTPEGLAVAYPSRALPGTYVWNRFVTISFSGNGDGVTGAQLVQVANAEGSTKLAAVAFERPGYEFVGWNTAADGTGVAFSDGDTLTKSDLTGHLGQTLTLYAQWKAVEGPTEPEKPVEPELPTGPETPTGPEKPTGPDTSGDGSDAEKPDETVRPAGSVATTTSALPQAGDATSSVLPVLLGIAGAALVVAVLVMRRRRGE